MNINERIIAQCILYFSKDDQYKEILSTLYSFKPASEILRKLIDARFSAILKNEAEPDIIGEFLAQGGTYAEYDIATEAIDDIITPSVLRGAITREENRVKAGEFRGHINDYELGRISLDDLISTIMETRTERQSSISLRALVEARNSAIEAQPLDMGFPVMNRALNGLMRTQMTILAARPGVGKSDLALALIRNVMKAGGSVLFASVEMDKFQVLRRLESGAGGLDRLLELPGQLEIYDAGDATVPQIAAMANAGSYDMVVVDYLQILNYPHRTNNSTERVTALSGQLRIAAKNSQAAWLVLSQLSRQVRDEHTEPSLADLRESGAIEQDAYAVLFLWEPYDRVHNSDSRTVAVKVAKNREGKTGYCYFRFIPRAHYWDEEEGDQ